MSFFEDLKRRNVIRVAAAYAVVAWIVIQVAETIFPLFGFSDGPARIVVILLAIGFPLTLVFSWLYEFTPDGLKLERDIDATRPNTRYAGKKLDRAIIVALAFALGYFAIDKFIFDPVRDVTLEEIVEERVRDQILLESSSAPSIAVLPFADMSPNGDQEYFGDGIAEELLNELARLKGLRVAGRTSSFSFKGKGESLSAIAEVLNVATILEGSIRKDGDQVRITAQLNNIADGRILWSKTYNREFAGIFAIQEEIATEVSGALGVTLGVGGVNAFRGAGTRNIEAYELYLEAYGQNNDNSKRLLERAVELDPNYAVAWARLAQHELANGWDLYPGENKENQERAYALALRAVELDPESARSILQIAQMLSARNDWKAAEEAYLKALSLLPDSRNLLGYGSLLMRSGRSAAALKKYEQSEAAAPLQGHRYFRVQVAIAQGRLADAREVLARSQWLPSRGVDLTIALHDGDANEIKDILAAKPPTDIDTIELYDPVLKMFDSPEKVLSELRALYADNNTRWPSKLHDIALLAAYFGDAELALHTMGEESRKGSPRMYAWWYPLMSEARQLQGFKELMTDLNLVAYWRASGWADQCRPVGDDDFTCW